MLAHVSVWVTPMKISKYVFLCHYSSCMAAGHWCVYSMTPMFTKPYSTLVGWCGFWERSKTVALVTIWGIAARWIGLEEGLVPHLAYKTGRTRRLSHTKSKHFVRACSTKPPLSCLKLQAAERNSENENEKECVNYFRNPWPENNQENNLIIW